jgi:hypothetical protein
VNLANECATSLASLLTQQKQQQAKVLLKIKILLITDEITQGLAMNSPLNGSKHTFASLSIIILSNFSEVASFTTHKKLLHNP